MARKVGIKNDALGLAERIVEKGPQARAMDFLDRHTKPLFESLYGWNLYVLRRTAHMKVMAR